MVDNGDGMGGSGGGAGASVGAGRTSGVRDEALWMDLRLSLFGGWRGVGGGCIVETYSSMAAMDFRRREETKRRSFISASVMSSRFADGSG